MAFKKSFLKKLLTYVKVMNLDKLKQAEDKFLGRYPGGFNDPDLEDISKKHNVPKMIDFCQQEFGKRSFERPDEILENMIKTINRSSMVSMFEKPKFKSIARIGKRTIN